MAKDNQQTGVTLLKKMMEKPDQSLSAAIGHRALKRYSVPAKPLQIDTVLNLARGRNVMLHAGTGFGKSRVAEMYYDLVPKHIKAVVLVLNPLDALGNNQVSEKKAAGFSAINLTKLTFNPAEAAKIRHGEYSFVYLSPEIFLNSKLFSSIYFSPEFQSCLALVVVDEAHLIYHWGMVKSARRKKKSSALGRHEDRGIFRPSYGNLYSNLQARNGAPILLLSATCPPRPLRAIQRNLRLDSTKLVILQGELTCPEIRIICVFMKGSMTLFTDLEDLYSPISDIPNKKVVPSLIYFSTRRKTGQVLEVLAPACGTPNDAS
jgi:superfamily II DNA helicase RecQ